MLVLELRLKPMADGREPAGLCVEDGDAGGAHLFACQADGAVADPVLLRVILLVAVRAEPVLGCASRHHLCVKTVHASARCFSKYEKGLRDGGKNGLEVKRARGLVCRHTTGASCP